MVSGLCETVLRKVGLLLPQEDRKLIAENVKRAYKGGCESVGPPDFVGIFALLQ